MTCATLPVSGPSHAAHMSVREPAERERVGESRFLTLQDVATYLNVSEPQVYALVRSGDLPAIKIGGRGVWRVDRRNLEEYVEKVSQQTAEWVRMHPLTKSEVRELHAS